ncbi:MAG: hypothetical protein IPM53_01775 [Anaerolineaceae bacterium]|nr:hypothetical protein [Anaerolineaceae bacterium]
MSNYPQMFLVEFHGRIDKYTFVRRIRSDVPRPGQEQSSNLNSEAPQTLNDLIFELNNGAVEIAEAIRVELSRVLPPSVNIYAQISFFEGSISWSGIITVVDWMDRIGGTIGFLEIVLRVSKFAIEKVMQHWFSYQQQRLGLELEEPIQVEVNSHMNTDHTNLNARLMRNNNRLNNLMMLLIGANTVLLLAILLIQIFSLF